MDDHGKSPAHAVQQGAQLCSDVAQPSPSRRVRATDSPVIAMTKAIMAASGRSDVASLAQGVVYWVRASCAGRRRAVP